VQRFFYQPAWLDFSIFWSAILAGASLAVILQMEFGGYDGLYWPAIGGLVLVILIAVLQVASLRLALTPDALVLGHVFPANRLTIAWSALNGVSIQGHVLILETRAYGKIRLVRLCRLQKLAAAFAQAGVKVTTRKGKSRIV
jgi:hypothetical protein